MPKFLISETIYSERVMTVRGGTTVQKHDNAENGKAVKLAAANSYILAAPGDAIEAIQGSSNLNNQGTVDGFAIIGIYGKGYKNVTFDGLQLTPGTGVIATGDFVVTGTVVPFGTALTAPLKVTKATTQATAGSGPFKARVVSLGNANTGAIGTTGVIELL
jgi:hypothetical protein